MNEHYGYFPTQFEIDDTDEDSLYPRTLRTFYLGGRANGKSTRTLYEHMRHMLSYQYGYQQSKEYYFKIEKVIFNDPATIVIWADGSKTVVKCQEGDVFDKEKGLAMAISKRALGDKGNYYEGFKKWIPEIEKSKVKTAEELIDTEVFFDDTSAVKEAIQRLGKSLRDIGNKYTYCMNCKNVDQRDEEETRNCSECQDYSRFKMRK